MLSILHISRDTLPNLVPKSYESIYYVPNLMATVLHCTPMRNQALYFLKTRARLATSPAYTKDPSAIGAVCRAALCQHQEGSAIVFVLLSYFRVEQHTSVPGR